MSRQTPERARESARRYRERHPDRVKQSQKKYEAANPRENNPERNRVYNLKRFHGMTPLEYEQLTRGKSTHIEHDHECCPAGESCFQCRRGLACSHCNLVIARALEDPDRLCRIADALERVIGRAP